MRKSVSKDTLSAEIHNKMPVSTVTKTITGKMARNTTKDEEANIYFPSFAQRPKRNIAIKANTTEFSIGLGN